MEKEGSRYSHPWKLLKRIDAPILPAVLAYVSVIGNPLFASISPICPTNLVILNTMFDIERQERIKSATTTIFTLLPNIQSRDSYCDDDDSSCSDDDDESLSDNSESETDEEIPVFNPIFKTRLIRHHNRFTYAPVPYPTFSTCGEIYPAIANSSHDKISCNGFHGNTGNMLSVNLKYASGNLCGKILASINMESIFIFLINYRMNNILNKCFITFFKMKNNFHLRFEFSIDIKSVLHNIPDDVWLLDWCISPNMKLLLLLTSDAVLNIIDFKSKTNVFRENLIDIFDIGEVMNFSHSVKSYCSVFYPFHGDRVILASLNSALCLYDWKLKRILYKHVISVTDGFHITHITISRNYRRMSICCGNGDIFVYTLNAYDFIEPFSLLLHLPPLIDYCKAISSSFTCSAEELCACYACEKVLIYQLPRIVNLLEICRLKMRTIYSRSEIEEFNIPNVLKRYLLCHSFKS